MTKSVIAKISRVFASVLGISILLSSFATPLMSVASAATAPSAKISFTFDDAEASAYTLAAPALQKYGYKGVEYVTTGCVGMTTVPNACAAEPNHAYMTWVQINELKNVYGWEIAGHTVTHPLLASTDPDTQPTALTKQQVINELLNSKTAIATYTGVSPVSFASPYGDYQPNGRPVLAEMAKLYSSHRGFADVGYNVFPYNDYLLMDQKIQGNVTVAAAKVMIDTAVANKTWLVLSFHHIIAGVASALEENYEYSVTNLEAIAAYAQSKGLAGTSIANGIATNAGNLFANGSFNTPISARTGVAATDKAVWNTDSAATIKQDTAGNGSYPDVTNSIAFASGAAATHLYSPMVPVAIKPYVFKSFINLIPNTDDLTKGEVAFYVEEYNAAGALLTTQYKKAWSVFATANPLVRQHTFEYTPAAGTASVRLQIVFPAASAGTGYLDNMQMWAQDGSTTGTPIIGKPGDANGDGKVDLKDATLVSLNWGKTGATLAQGDLNADGKIDLKDATLISLNWGK